MNKIFKHIIVIIIFFFLIFWFYGRPSICLTYLEDGETESKAYSVIIQGGKRIDGVVKKGETQCIRYTYVADRLLKYISLGFGEASTDIYNGMSAKIILHNNKTVAHYQEYPKRSLLSWMMYALIILFLYIIVLYFFWRLRKKSTT